VLLLAVEVRLLAVLRGGVELRPQVLELLHTGANASHLLTGEAQASSGKLVTAPAKRGSFGRPIETKAKSGSGGISRIRSRAAYLERLDEAPAPLHGRLVEGGGSRAGGVGPGHPRRRRLLLLHRALCSLAAPVSPSRVRWGGAGREAGRARHVRRKQGSDAIRLLCSCPVRPASQRPAAARVLEVAPPVCGRAGVEAGGGVG
jgi:hypothetical protein